MRAGIKPVRQDMGALLHKILEFITAIPITKNSISKYFATVFNILALRTCSDGFRCWNYPFRRDTPFRADTPFRRDSRLFAWISRLKIISRGAISFRRREFKNAHIGRVSPRAVSAVLWGKFRDKIRGCGGQ